MRHLVLASAVLALSCSPASLAPPSPVDPTSAAPAAPVAPVARAAQAAQAARAARAARTPGALPGRGATAWGRIDTTTRHDHRAVSRSSPRSDERPGAYRSPWTRIPATPAPQVPRCVRKARASLRATQHRERRGELLLHGTCVVHGGCGEQPEHRGPERPEIALRVDLVPASARLLGRHEGGRPHADPGLRGGARLVRRLPIAMDARRP